MYFERIEGKEKSKLIYLYKEKSYNTFLKLSTIYLKKYPNDSDIRFKRAMIYRNLKEFNNCINDYKYILSLGPNKNSYYKQALSKLYFTYYYLNMYEEALKLLPELYEKRAYDLYSISTTELVMKQQLGIYIRLKKDVKCIYVRSQIFNYSSDLALNHIKEHKYEEENKSYFNENLDIEYLFKLIRKSIDNSKKCNIDSHLEEHYFAIPNVGYSMSGNLCNVIKVVVVPNTNNIMTMYPTDKYIENNLCNLECDYDKLFKVEKPKVKTMSRIDKFNQRYKRV